MSQEIPKLPRCKADDDNMEKLHQAARRGQTELVRRLVNSGILVNIPNKFGCTALHLAAKHGHVAMVRELASKAPAANLSSQWHGRRPLTLAVCGGHKECVLALVEGAKAQGLNCDAFLAENDECDVQEVGRFRKACTGQSAMHWAVGLQNKEIVQMLLSLGCNPMTRDRVGEAALLRTIEFGDDEMLDVLLAARPRLDVTDKYSKSALHWAIEHNRKEMASKLLAAGVDVNLEDSEHTSASVYAARRCQMKLLQDILKNTDNEVFVNASIHDGKTVQEERVGFLSGTPEERIDIIRELQSKLDQIVKERGGPQRKDFHFAGKERGGVAALHFAPSAPVNERSKK